MFKSFGTQMEIFSPACLREAVAEAAREIKEDERERAEVLSVL